MSSAISPKTQKRAGKAGVRPFVPGPILKFLMEDMGNPIISSRLRSAKPGKLAESVLLLTFTGRKSGKEFTTPVGYTQHGDTLTVFTGRPWWKNLQERPNVRVWVRGRDLDGVAQVMTDNAEVARAAQAFIAEQGAKNAQRIGLLVARGCQPTYQELLEATRDRVVILIKVAE
ncbi:MAG TPA: nitroreductase family deazaflavin-dependent oxidoreductase [Chloroflexia bacterium]|nr:nitroreductase family deazaflavin-dependent oxidoreductase [Chloroflexia bacterium]